VQDIPLLVDIPLLQQGILLLLDTPLILGIPLLLVDILLLKATLLLVDIPLPQGEVTHHPQVRCQGSFQEVLSLGMVPLPLLEVVHMGDSPLQEDMELHPKQVGMVPHPQQVGTEPNPQQVVMEPHPQQVGMVPLLLLVDTEHSMVVMVPSILRSSHHSKAMQLKLQQLTVLLHLLLTHLLLSRSHQDLHHPLLPEVLLLLRWLLCL